MSRHTSKHLSFIAIHEKTPILFQLERQDDGKLKLVNSSGGPGDRLWDSVEDLQGYLREEQHLFHFGGVFSLERLEVRDGKLIALVDHSTDLSQGLPELLLQYYPDKVMQFLDHVGGKFQEPIDWNTYEGGVKSWWGVGSVSMWELGLSFTTKLSSEGVQLTIE